MLAKLIKVATNKTLFTATRLRTGGVGLTRNPDALRSSVLNTLQAFDRDLFGGLGSSLLPSPYESPFGAVHQMEQHLPALKMDYYETPSEYKVEMEVPGVRKEDVTLKVKNGCLHVTARKVNLNSYSRTARIANETSIQQTLDPQPSSNWGDVIFHKSERGLSKL